MVTVLERNKNQIAKDFISETTEVVRVIYLMILGDLFCCNTCGKFDFNPYRILASGITDEP